MNVSVLVPPPVEPVTLAEVYASLRLDVEGSPASHADDASLLRHIQSSREMVEKMTRRSLVQQTLRLSASRFPPTETQAASMTLAERLVTPRAIYLFRPPVVEVLSVKYYDSSNDLQIIAPGDYYVTDEQVPQLRFVSTFAVPEVYDRPDAVRVEYVTGYSGEGSPAPSTQEEYAANVPAQLKDAIILGVQIRYDSLTPADLKAVTDTIEALVQPFRVQLAL